MRDSSAFGVAVLVAVGAASSGCTSVVVDEAPTEQQPLTCDLREGALVLVPHADNPGSRATPVSCDVWFGHGQHLTCPGFAGPPSPVTIECDIWDCLCEEPDVVANFATGEVIDARDGELCRYTMDPAP